MCYITYLRDTEAVVSSIRRLDCFQSGIISTSKGEKYVCQEVTIYIDDCPNTKLNATILLPS